MKRRKSYFKNSGKPPLYVSRYKINFISLQDLSNPNIKNTEGDRQEVTIIYDNGVDLVIQLKAELEKKNRPIDYKSIPWYLLTDEEVREDLNKRVETLLTIKRIKKITNQTKAFIRKNGFDKISICTKKIINVTKNSTNKIVYITSKPRQVICKVIDTRTKGIRAILRKGRPLLILVDYILIVINEKASRIVQVDANNETNRNIDFINYTKVLAVTGGVGNCLRGTVDLIEAFVVRDRLCFITSLIGITADLLQILVTLTEGANFVVFVAIPISSICKVIVWCNRRLIIPWGDYTTTLRIMQFKNLRIHIPQKRDWRMA